MLEGGRCIVAEQMPVAVSALQPAMVPSRVTKKAAPSNAIRFLTKTANFGSGYYNNCRQLFAQLRTGMARLNTYLYRIRATSTDRCACGQARETVDHFRFRCRRSTSHRTELLQCTETRRWDR